LAITAKDVVEKLSKAEIALITTSPQDIDEAKLAILKKAFDTTPARATDDQIMAGLQIQKIGPDGANQYSLKLTVKPGYLINEDAIELISNEFTVNVDFTINKESTISGMTMDEIKTFQDEFTAVTEEQIISLKKVFDFGDIPSLFKGYKNFKW
jgi:D-arabinose 1-dehydrogenase-like Zn-dependent alcohol dehydrogenase